MASYAFSTITADQALAFDGAADSLSVSTPILGFTATFDDVAGHVTLTDASNGRSVVFGSGLYGEMITSFAGSGIQILTAGDDTSGWPGVVVFGGGGSDTIARATDAYGGAGGDLFVIDDPYVTRIHDWEVTDAISMTNYAPLATAANYVEATRSTAAEADAFAQQQVIAGKDYAVVAVGADLYVYGDQDNRNDGTSLVKTVLVGAGLDQIDFGNFVGGRSPAVAYSGVTGDVRGNMDTAHLSSLVGMPIETATSTTLYIHGATASMSLTGSGFTYDSHQQITGGQVSNLGYSNAIFGVVWASQTAISASQFGTWVATDATQQAFATILAGNDKLNGWNGADLIRGFGGDDLIYGLGGSDTIFGGAGNDQIYAVYPPSLSGGATSGLTYLRGEEGNDFIVGGSAFDDLHGNQGDDTVNGAYGDDWVVGGQGNDMLLGEAGGDVVYGNLGADTCLGGEGNDWVRGGQANDSLLGGGGDDLIWGDRGDDTMAGGLGADMFHTLVGAGLDRVTDFNYTQGDRIVLDGAPAYTVRQEGADTVIDLGGADRMVLVAVTAASLPAGWLIVG
ncbi:calcium-binding protein [Phenylobacterium sp.]|uniref:calcium-binding protein n=1 Tax=Phenylobacterium sp. TaxID=1871053 RepID=UPI003BADB5C3